MITLCSPSCLRLQSQLLPESAAPPAAPPVGDKDPPAGSCWRYTHAGTCDLDEKDCRFNHPGEKSAFKHIVADDVFDDGFCKMEQSIRRGHCNGDQCPFLHSLARRIPLLHASLCSDLQPMPLLGHRGSQEYLLSCDKGSADRDEVGGIHVR